MAEHIETSAEDRALVKLLEEATQFAAAGLHDFLKAAASIRSMGRTLRLCLEIDANGSLSVEPQLITPPVDANGLRTDGPTLAEWVGAGYSAEGYPPSGYASREPASSETASIAAMSTAEVAQLTTSEAEALTTTDSGALSTSEAEGLTTTDTAALTTTDAAALTTSGPAALSDAEDPSAEDQA